MLKNASILAIVGLDTAENGPSKVRQVTNRIEAIIELKAELALCKGEDELALAFFKALEQLHKDGLMRQAEPALQLHAFFGRRIHGT